MKKTRWMILPAALLTVGAWAQDAPAANSNVIETENAYTFPIERLKAPTYADENCAGFMNKETLPDSKYVTGGVNSPNATKFMLNDPIYLAGGGYATGQEFTVVREIKNVNEDEAYNGQRKMVRAAGHAYAELGRVRVLDTRNHQAVAQVEYSCEPIVAGDTLLPFVEKTHITLRETGRLDRFAPPNGKTTGRLVLARDFDSFLGTGSKVYLNIGANQGVKVGDYFKAVRPYWMDRDDEVDSISLSARVVEETQRHPPSIEPAMFTRDGSPTIRLKDYPRRAVGELLILNVTPTSSTAMVIFSLEDLHLGDFAELE